MFPRTATLLTAADRFSKQLGFIDHAVTALTSRVLPQTTAQACTPHQGWVYCEGDCEFDASCATRSRQILYYASGPAYCGTPYEQSCKNGCCGV